MSTDHIRFDMLVKDYKRIGDRIQQIRKQSGFSQDEHPLSCDYSSIIDKIDSLPPDKKQADIYSFILLSDIGRIILSDSFRIPDGFLFF